LDTTAGRAPSWVGSRALREERLAKGWEEGTGVITLAFEGGRPERGERQN